MFADISPKKVCFHIPDPDHLCEGPRHLDPTLDKISPKSDAEFLSYAYRQTDKLDYNLPPPPSGAKGKMARR